jgi:hypothetical protein
MVVARQNRKISPPERERRRPFSCTSICFLDNDILTKPLFNCKCAISGFWPNIGMTRDVLDPQTITIGMIRNYLRVALRGLLKNKSYFVINIFGLGISLACCITAYLLLAFNIEFDNFHDDKKVANIFKIHTLSTEKNGTKVIDNQSAYCNGTYRR